MHIRWDWIFEGGAIAAVIAFWNQIKSMFGWVVGWFFITHTTSKSLGRLVISYLEANGKRRDRGRFYISLFKYIRPLENTGRIIFHAIHKSRSRYWVHGRPVWVSGPAAGPRHDSDDAPVHSDNDSVLRFTVLRFTIDWEKLLLSVVDWESVALKGDDVKAGRFCIRKIYGEDGVDVQYSNKRRKRSSEGPDDDQYSGDISYNGGIGMRPLGWRMDEIGIEASEDAIDRLSLTPELKSVVEEIKFWKRSESWYADRGIPWRRGYQFYGKPGCGKSIVTRSIAEALDFPIYSYDLASLTNKSFSDEWRDMVSQNKSCIALIEDIDAVFNGRKNVRPGNGLTFDCLLNCINGVEEADGVLLVITTNNPEMIDPALGAGMVNGRPGRIDRAVEFKGLDHDGRLKMAIRILGDNPRAHEAAAGHADSTAAQFQEWCFRIALDNYWNDAAKIAS